MDKKPRLRTVKQFCKENDFLTESSLRWHIFNEYNNGLKKSKAIVRLGGKILIDEEKFYQWILDQNE